MRVLQLGSCKLLLYTPTLSGALVGCYTSYHGNAKSFGDDTSAEWVRYDSWGRGLLKDVIIYDVSLVIKTRQVMRS